VTQAERITELREKVLAAANALNVATRDELEILAADLRESENHNTAARMMVAVAYSGKR
jgi:hypothetical protein